MMEALVKEDLKKSLKQFYNAPAKEVEIVEVPQFNYLMIDGRGDPNTAIEYADAVEALYSVSYTLKFTVKKTQGVDYSVMPLEGLWWTEDMANFSTEHKENWSWTMLIMQPLYVTQPLVEQALEQVREKKALAALAKLQFENWEEGLASQIMHLGPYATEAPTIQKLHDYIQEHGYQLSGKHHEIYLSDPRRVAPERMRTIIRQPMTRAE